MGYQYQAGGNAGQAQENGDGRWLSGIVGSGRGRSPLDQGSLIHAARGRKGQVPYKRLRAVRKGRIISTSGLVIARRLHFELEDKVRMTMHPESVLTRVHLRRGADPVQSALEGSARE